MGVGKTAGSFLTVLFKDPNWSEFVEFHSLWHLP